MMAIQGLYCGSPKPPLTLGYEVSGYVDAFGEGANGVVSTIVPLYFLIITIFIIIP